MRLRSSISENYSERGIRVLDYYSPDYIADKHAGEEACVGEDHPTLARLNAMFDESFSTSWLMAQLYDLSEYCGVKDKLSSRMLTQCARVISANYYYLKVTELLLFFSRFKAGRYGHFYGSVDPLVIMQALREFIAERNDMIDEIENRRQEERKRQQASAKNDTITYEEWQMVKHLAAMYNSEYTQNSINISKYL